MKNAYNAKMSDEQQHNETDSKPPGFLSLVASALSAAIGVQSEKNRQRDFSQGNYRHFIIIGIVLTVVFVLTVIAVVRLVLSTAGN